MRRRTAIALGVAVVIAAIAVWRCCGQTTDSVGTDEHHARHTAMLYARARVDPATVKRSSIAGVVSDDAKRSIANARVCAIVVPDPVYMPTYPPSACVTSDPRGAYKLDRLLPGRYAVSAVARGYRPAMHVRGIEWSGSEVPLRAGEARTDADIVLRPGGVELVGTVSDLTGGPVARARVVAWGGWNALDSPRSTTEADDLGRFALWVEPGEIRVSAAADKYGSATTRAIAPGTIEITMTPESTLSGTVVDPAGRPVEGAAVTIDDDALAESARTDASGAFHVAGLKPGHVALIARTANGVGRTAGSIRIGLAEHVAGIVIRVQPGSSVEATVVGATGNACDHPRAVLEDGRDRSVRMYPLDGMLVADGVLPGTYTPTVWCGSAHVDLEPLAIANADVAGIVWRVAPRAGATIRGNITTKSGRPVDGAMISTLDAPTFARTQWDGSYVMHGFAPGRYRFLVSSADVEIQQFGVDVDSPSQVIEHDLVVEDAGTIEGVTVDASGRGSAGRRRHSGGAGACVPGPSSALERERCIRDSQAGARIVSRRGRRSSAGRCAVDDRRSRPHDTNTHRRRCQAGPDRRSRGGSRRSAGRRCVCRGAPCLEREGLRRGSDA